MELSLVCNRQAIVRKTRICVLDYSYKFKVLECLYVMLCQFEVDRYGVGYRLKLLRSLVLSLYNSDILGERSRVLKVVSKCRRASNSLRDLSPAR
jgi:hypothetical protein